MFLLISSTGVFKKAFNGKDSGKTPPRSPLLNVSVLNSSSSKRSSSNSSSQRTSRNASATTTDMASSLSSSWDQFGNAIEASLSMERIGGGVIRDLGRSFMPPTRIVNHRSIDNLSAETPKIDKVYR